MLSIQRTWQWIKSSPVAMTFLLSIALSLVSLSYRASMNPDGMVHVMAGRIFVEEGFRASLHYFDWPFFSILIGIAGYLLPVSYEAAGHLINILMLSTACALLVKITQRYVPNSAWLACLVVLALPAINENRHEILREDGAWLFLILALWLAIRAPNKISWLNTLGVCVAILIAALFRAEFAIFYPALVIWQYQALKGTKPTEKMKLFIIPGIFLLATAALALTISPHENLARIENFIGILDLNAVRAIFDNKSTLMDQYIMNSRWTRDGSLVLGWGLIGYSITSLIENCYALTVPLVLGIINNTNARRKFSPFGWLFLIYSLVVIAFVFRRYFLSDRYTAPLAIFCIPLITYGLHNLYQNKKKIAAITVTALLALNSLDNIISTGDQATHLVDAGHWIRENNIPEEATYIDFARIAYHADWPKYDFKFDEPTDARRNEAYNDPAIRYITIWSHSSDEELEWLNGKQLELLAEFKNSKGRKVLIFKKREPN